MRRPSRSVGASLLLGSVVGLAPAVAAEGQAGPPPGVRPSVPRSEATVADPRLLEAIEHYTGVNGHVDDAEARRLLVETAEAEAGPLALMWMARVFSRGRMAFPQDEARAREVAGGVIDDVRDLAAAGDVEAFFLMGTAYDEGLGVAVDHPEAMRWYRRAADRGHVLAAHNVGNMYRDGRGVEIDPGAAVRWWLRAARAGDVIPALRLGRAYEEGWGVAPDLDAARFWYGRAADAGNADASRALLGLRGTDEEWDVVPPAEGPGAVPAGRSPRRSSLPNVPPLNR